jgi:hypothetical protein
MLRNTTIRAPPPSHFIKLKEKQIEDEVIENINKWNKEILENLLPQFVLYEPECHNLKKCIENIKKAFQIIYHFIRTGEDKNNLSNSNFILENYDKKNELYKEYSKNYVRILREIGINKIDNCRNKFRYLDGLEDISKIIMNDKITLGSRLDTAANVSLNRAYLETTDIKHIDRIPSMHIGHLMSSNHK